MKKLFSLLCCLALALACLCPGAMALDNPQWSKHEDALIELTQKILDRGYMVGAMEFETYTDADSGKPALYWPLLDQGYATVIYDTYAPFEITYAIPYEMWDDVDVIYETFTDFLMIFTGQSESEARETLASLEKHYDEVEETMEGSYLVSYGDYSLAFVYNYLLDSPTVEVWYVGN